MTDSDNSKFEAFNETRPCSECVAGLMHLQFITYFTWLGDELVTVPNFPAWVCDVCGRREYDERALSWLTVLLNPTAGRPSSPRRRPLPPNEPPRTTRPTVK